jgi:hypothetical protein
MRDLQSAAAELVWQLPDTEQARDFLVLMQQIRTWG